MISNLRDTSPINVFYWIAAPGIEVGIVVITLRNRKSFEI